MNKRRAEALVNGLLRQIAPKAKSLIVTCFGDAVLPHGGICWLGSLIRLLRPFGLGDRLVRTSVFRLGREGWLNSTPVGRRSLYTVTETGRRRFEAADQRIYAGQRQGWNGEWTFVLASDRTRPVDPKRPPGDEGAGASLARQLQWLGFGEVGQRLYAHPVSDSGQLRLLLRDLGIGQDAVIFRARAETLSGSEPLRALARRIWDLEQVEADYQAFLDLFRPVLSALSQAGDPPPELCFMARTLLIHEYRRIVLRDPMLPEALLPGEWTGRAAWLLCRNLYRLTEARAERHLCAILETADGPVTRAHPPYFQRFGGLRDA